MRKNTEKDHTKIRNKQVEKIMTQPVPVNIKQVLCRLDKVETKKLEGWLFVRQAGDLALMEKKG